MSKAPEGDPHRSRCIAYVQLWHNPMARGWDKARPLVHAFLLALWLLLLPVAATIGSVTADRALGEADRHAAQLTVADAVVLVAIPPAFGTNGNPVHRMSQTLVRWTTRDGRLLEAQAPASSGTPVGAHVSIALDGNDNPVPPPASSLDVVSTITAVVLVVWLWVGAFFWLLDIGAHQLHLRSSSRRSAGEWAAVSTRWTREVC